MMSRANRKLPVLVMISFLAALLVVLWMRSNEDTSSIRQTPAAQSADTPEGKAVMHGEPRPHGVSNNEVNFDDYELSLQEAKRVDPSQIPPPPDRITYKSIHPGIPANMIRANLAQAEAGDPQAQWNLFLAFSECAAGPTTDEGYQEVYNGNFLPSIRASQLWTYQRCIGVHDTFENLAEERNHWLNQAALNDYPTAVLYQAVNGYPPEHDNIPIEVVYRALETGDSQAYMSAALYQAVTKRTAHEHDLEVWGLLSCRANSGCSDENFAEDLSQRYAPYQIQEIEERATEILDSVRRKDFQRIF